MSEESTQTLEQPQTQPPGVQVLLDERELRSLYANAYRIAYDPTAKEYRVALTSLTYRE